MLIHVSKQDSQELTPNAIRSAARETAIREIASQKDLYQQLGIMADWSPESTYRTLGARDRWPECPSYLISAPLDHSYEMRQLRIFQKMVEKGLQILLYVF